MSVTEEDRRRIADRYPTRRRPWLIPVIVVPVVALLGLWLWISAYYANPPLEAKLTSFDVRSPSEIHVTLMVQRPDPSQAGHCLVYAQSKNFEKVGEMQVPVPPGPEKVGEVSATIRTYRLSTSASVASCSVP